MSSECLLGGLTDDGACSQAAIDWTRLVIRELIPCNYGCNASCQQISLPSAPPRASLFRALKYLTTRIGNKVSLALLYNHYILLELSYQALEIIHLEVLTNPLKFSNIWSDYQVGICLQFESGAKEIQAILKGSKHFWDMSVYSVQDNWQRPLHSHLDYLQCHVQHVIVP